MAEGEKCVKARLAAKGYQGPNLQEGQAGASGCVSLRSSHLQVISLGALKKWNLPRFDIQTPKFPLFRGAEGDHLQMGGA